MNKLLMSLFVLCVAVGPVFAQGGGGNVSYDDMIGIYFDEDGDRDCATGVLPGFFHFYVVIENLTSPGVAGFEMKLEVEGAYTFFNLQLTADQYIDVATKPGEVIAGFAAPVMAVDGKLVIMTFDGILDDEDPVTFFTKPVYFPSIAGYPCYLDSDDNQIVKSLMPVSGDAEVGVLFLNAGHCGPVPAEKSDWGAVKSLYR